MGKSKNQIAALDVYIESKLVGTLIEKSTGAMTFKYAKSWLETKGVFPISQSLPLSAKELRGAEVRAYFNNLLPDNPAVREKMAGRVGAESEGDFDLLSAIGRDCVGACRFIPAGTPIPKGGGAKGEKVSPKRIAEILRGLPVTPLGNHPDQDFRISIAGAQDKTGFLRMESSWMIPQGDTPTTHIFKVPMGQLPNGIDLTTSVENEWLCLQLVKCFDLSAAEADIKTFSGEKCLAVTRFDRKWSKDGAKLSRIPQEDLCQALGISSAKKYESDGGPGITQIMDFLLESDDPNEDRRLFMKTQVVFGLLGATDGHAKNYSIFASKAGGFRLTPIYDVMSVYPAWKRGQIRRNQMKLAMALGDSRHYRLYEIKGRHWLQTAKRCGFSTKELEQILDEVCQAAKVVVQKGIKTPKGFPAWILQAILEEMDRAVSRLEIR